VLRCALRNLTISTHQFRRLYLAASSPCAPPQNGSPHQFPDKFAICNPCKTPVRSNGVSHTRAGVFETFILERFERPLKPFHPTFRVLFNSYYNGIGDKHPRTSAARSENRARIPAQYHGTYRTTATHKSPTCSPMAPCFPIPRDAMRRVPTISTNRPTTGTSCPVRW
jgi:hypothetical protein